MLRPPLRVGGRTWKDGSALDGKGFSTDFIWADSWISATGPVYASRSTGTG